MNELSHDWTAKRTRLRGRLSVRTGQRKPGDPEPANDSRDEPARER